MNYSQPESLDNATIVEDYNISSVVLMYKNSSASDWSLVTMSNNSVLIVAGFSSVVYNASFIPYGETWEFKINMFAAFK